jgi:hypothetical protein
MGVSQKWAAQREPVIFLNDALQASSWLTDLVEPSQHNPGDANGGTLFATRFSS